jgi:hypothetical protein
MGRKLIDQVALWFAGLQSLVQPVQPVGCLVLYTSLLLASSVSSVSLLRDVACRLLSPPRAFGLLFFVEAPSLGRRGRGVTPGCSGKRQDGMWCRERDQVRKLVQLADAHTYEREHEARWSDGVKVPEESGAECKRRHLYGWDSPRRSRFLLAKACFEVERNDACHILPPRGGPM